MTELRSTICAHLLLLHSVPHAFPKKRVNFNINTNDDKKFSLSVGMCCRVNVNATNVFVTTAAV